MLLLPKGRYIFRQELLSMEDEIMNVDGQIWILNGRPQTKDGKHGVKLEMLISEGTEIIIRSKNDETVTG